MRRWIPVYLAALLLFANGALRFGTADTSTGTAVAQEEEKGGNRIEVDNSDVEAIYANFVRVTGNPEEMIIDFGLNPQPTQLPDKPIRIDQRVVMNYFTAKRMMAALNLSLERHEAAFGPVETDIRKRARAGVQ